MQEKKDPKKWTSVSCYTHFALNSIAYNFVFFFGFVVSEV